MMPVLLLWFLLAPSLPGADSDAVIVAGRLRPRVVRMLGKVVVAGVAMWLAACGVGTIAFAAAVLAHEPRFAACGPIAAAFGALGGFTWTIAVCFLEKAWINALALPADWRGPWLAGELAEHMRWKRRTMRFTPTPTPGRATRAPAVARLPVGLSPRPAIAPDSVVTPIERWMPEEDGPTELIAWAGADGAWRTEATEEAASRPAARVPRLRFRDEGRIATPVASRDATTRHP